MSASSGRRGWSAGQTQGAISLRVSGVPAWVIDERLLVPGAQPYEVFDRVMERLGHEPVEHAPLED
jgi:predicted DsbA family dithiol-disulfide isomerase